VACLKQHDEASSIEPTEGAGEPPPPGSREEASIDDMTEVQDF